MAEVEAIEPELEGAGNGAEDAAQQGSSDKVRHTCSTTAPSRNRRSFHRPAKGGCVDCRIPVEPGLDLRAAQPQLFAADQAPRQHLTDVVKVLRVAGLDLRQGLGGEVVVVERELALAAGEGAALALKMLSLELSTEAFRCQSAILGTT